MDAHAFLPPSGAGAWAVCAAWPHMARRYPQPDTPEAMEGTAAHWLFAELFAGQQIAPGLIAPNGVVATEEMVDGAELFYDTVTTTAPGLQYAIESRVSCQAVHEQCWGTPDAWAWDRANGVLYVWDYKFGHRFVDEYENLQLILYALGASAALGADHGLAPGHAEAAQVVLTVVQPRCYHRGAPVRTWRPSLAEVYRHIKTLQEAAYRACAPNPDATPNPECEYCPGRHACQALQRAGYEAAHKAYSGAPLELTPAAASLELRMLQRALSVLEARCSGLEEAVSAHAKAGASVPFHRLEATPPRKSWTVKPEEVVALGQLMNVNLSRGQYTAPMTPTQALKAGVDAAVISFYSSDLPGKLRLIPHNPADVARVFGKP